MMSFMHHLGVYKEPIIFVLYHQIKIFKKDIFVHDISQVFYVTKEPSLLGDIILISNKKTPIDKVIPTKHQNLTSITNFDIRCLSSMILLLILCVD